MLKKLACAIALTFGLVACNGEKAPENNLAADASGTTGNAASAPISAATSAPVAPVASFKEVTIPSGTTLRLSLQSAVASDSSRVEQPFERRCGRLSASMGRWWCPPEAKSAVWSPRPRDQDV
jgi:hypothetical protein